MKVAPLAGAGVGVTAAALARRGPGPAEERTGTCRFCLMHCGVKASLEGGALRKVEGDLASRTRGFVCHHGFALTELVHSPERVRRPMIRRGDDFDEVSWDEALGFIADRLDRVRSRFGAQAVALQTGWPFVRHPMVGFFHRFLRAFGSPNVATVSSLCEGALRMGQALTVGTKYSPDFAHAKTLVVWGANPAVTAPPLAHVVANKAAEGALIVIDPVATALAKAATLHLQIRPGTDGALALGLINAVVTRRPPDQGLRTRLEGFDALASLAGEFPLERVAALTSISLATLQRTVELLLADRRVGVWQGLGVEHHVQGVQTVRAITVLEVLCGRFDEMNPAGFVSPVTARFHDEPLPALYRMRTPSPAPPELSVEAVGRAALPLFERYNREAHAELLADAMLNDTPYPVRALVAWGSNPLVTSSNTPRMEAAVRRLELLVTVDPFFSQTAKHSHVVLPASLFAEAVPFEGPAEPLAPRQHEARDDWDILRALAMSCGLGQWFPWPSLREALAAPHVAWMKDDGQQPHPQPDAAPDFGTPTGKAELESTVLRDAGHEPLPRWSELPAVTADFPLTLVTGPRPRARINSQFSASQRLAARLGEAEALLHPDVAHAAGVAHGAPVAVVTASGRVVFRAVVTEDVHRECVVVPAGWATSNANQLTGDVGRDPISGFPAFRSARCRIEAVLTPPA